MPPRPCYVEVPLRWSDMDALRHVNNVQFVRLLEEARIHALHEWYLGHEQAQPTLLVARQEIEYLAQLTYRPAPIVVAVWVARVQAASFDLSYEVMDSRHGGSQVYAVAESSQVAFDVTSQRPVRLSAAYRDRLEQFRAPPAVLRRRPGPKDR